MGCVFWNETLASALVGVVVGIVVAQSQAEVGCAHEEMIDVGWMEVVNDLMTCPCLGYAAMAGRLEWGAVWLEALELGSLERKFALAVLVRDQSYPVGLAAGMQETHMALEHRTVRLESVERGCVSFHGVARCLHSQKELPFLEIAIVLQICRGLWDE